MKKIYLITILAISSFTLTAQPSDSIDWQAVINDYYTKYQPQKSPAWLFPLIFEEGTGQRDTIYLGFDKRADGNNHIADTIFGERFRLVDSTKFHAAFNSNVFSDYELSKVDITKTNSGLVNHRIEFRNGMTPFTIYWDVSLFYHDSLRLFIDTLNYQPNTPYSGATMAIDYYRTLETIPCNWVHYPIITDTIPFGQGGLCMREDSIHLVVDLPNPFPVSMFEIPAFRIEPWTQLWVSTDDKRTITPKLYPNPTYDFITIELETLNGFEVIIHNALGQQLKQSNTKENRLQIDLSSFPKGLYFLQVKTEGYKVKVVKVLKQ